MCGMSEPAPTPILAAAIALAERAAAAATDLGGEGITDDSRRDLAAAVSDAPADLRVLFLAFQFHFRIGELGEAERFARRRLDLAPANSADAGRALCNLGLICHQRGELDEAETFIGRSLEIDRAIGNRLGIARDLGTLAMVPETRGDLGRAEALYLESLAIARSLEGPEAEDIAAGKLANLGDIARARGQPDEARALWTQAIAIFERLGITKWRKDFARRMAEMRPHDDGRA